MVYRTFYNFFDYCEVVDLLSSHEKRPGSKPDEGTAAIISVAWMVAATETFGIGA